jgi:hypothetical protein
MIGKIFGIGLSRTGTRSLSEALEILGIRTAHLPLDRRTYRELASGVYALTVLTTCDALTDITAAPFYRRFDQTYPNSKFILTARDKDSWMRSMQRLNRRWLEEAARGPVGRLWHRFRFEHHVHRNLLRSLVNSPDHLRTTLFIRTAMYGGLAFRDERQLSDVYDAHHRAVSEYFRSRPNDLLRLDICGGEEWEPLCRFLDKPIPERAFPHTGRPGI